MCLGIFVCKERNKIDGSVAAGRKQRRVEVVRLCSYLDLGIGFFLEDFGIKKL